MQLLPCRWKNLSRHPLFKHIGTTALLFGLLCLTFYIRIQGVEHIPTEHFTSYDAFLFRGQVEKIAELGYLPARDMHRWIPFGRDNTQLLSLYPYAIAYTHKAIAWAFPKLTRYHIQCYAAPVCFTLGLGILFLFLKRHHSILFAAIVVVLLATLPGSIDRSTAGFGDRDAWCWMLGVLAVTSYLYKDQMAPGYRRWIVTALAGFTCFMGGMSWEGFGFFVLMIAAIELYKFSTTDTEAHLKEYLLYLLMFVPCLYLVSPAYHSGYGFSTHVTALMLLPPLVISALRCTRYLLLKYVKPLRPHARKLAWGFTLLAMIAGIGYFFLQADTFETTAYPFRESHLMKSIGELIDPDFNYWRNRYGSIFLLGSLGMIIACLQLWKWKGVPLALTLSLFSVTTFFREQIDAGIGDNACNTLFFTSFGLTVLCLGITCLEKKRPKNEFVTLATLVWFLLWVGLSRGGKRHDFFTGVPFAYGTALLLWNVPALITEKLKSKKILHPEINSKLITSCLAIIVFIVILFLPTFAGYANKMTYNATIRRKPIPEHGSMKQGLGWMKTTLPQDTVVAASWSYGNQLNVLGGVKTITDSDHYIPHWIHLYFRHVFCAQSEREALEFLKTHGATHLMLTQQELIFNTPGHSIIGSTEDADRKFELVYLAILPKKVGAPQRLANLRKTSFAYIEAIDPDAESPPDVLTARMRNRDIARLPYVAFKDRTRHFHEMSGAENLHGGVILYYETHQPDEHQHLNKAFYVPTTGWNSLAVRLYFLGDLPDIFVPVYPSNGDATADVKIWEIHYPPDIQTDPKYLETGFPEIDNHLHTQ